MLSANCSIVVVSDNSTSLSFSTSVFSLFRQIVDQSDSAKTEEDTPAESESDVSAGENDVENSILINFQIHRSNLALYIHRHFIVFFPCKVSCKRQTFID